MNKVKTLSCILLIITLFFCSGRQLFGQEKIHITTGIGFPEMLNIGFRYQFEQSQIGLSFGGFSSSFFGNYTSLSGDYYYHFGLISKFSELPSAYVRAGLNCLISNDGKLSSYVRIGNDFYFTKNLGISLDIGIGLHLNQIADWGG